MAVQFSDFNQAPDEGFLSKILQGYSALNSFKRLPQENQQRAQGIEASRLANSLAQAREPYNEQTALLDNEMKQAKIQQLLRANSGRNLTPSGDMANALYLAQAEAQLGANHPEVVAMKEQFKLQQDKDRALMSHRENMSQSRDWSTLGQAAKENTLSLGRAINPQMTDTELAKFFREGGTFQELAQASGVSPEKLDDLSRQYAATNATISSIQQGKGAEAELAVMDDFITTGLEKYVDRFAGYSPTQIANAFSNEPRDIDDQAKFLAARAIAAEQSAIRARLAGASNAQEALRELKNLSLNEAKIFRPQVKREVYRKMQAYISDTLTKAAHARFDAMSPKFKRKDDRDLVNALNKPATEENDPLGLFK